MPIQLIGAPLFNIDGFPVAAWPEPHHPPFPPHTHTFHELVIVTQGSALHFWDETCSRLMPGTVLIIEPGSVHSYDEVDGLALINVVFQPEELGLSPVVPWETAGAGRERARWRGFLDAAALAAAEGLALAMQNEIAERGPCYRYAVINQLRALLLLLARSGGGAPPDHPGDDESAMDIRIRIRHALRVIIRQHGDSIDIAQLAREAGMSMRTFRRHFQRAAGMCPAAYLTRVRVRKAAFLLQTTELPVTDVAFAAGFTDLSFFNRSFKSIVDESPRTFRTRLRQRRESVRRAEKG
jgi:AraC-like DNA-binding protein